MSTLEGIGAALGRAFPMDKPPAPEEKPVPATVPPLSHRALRLRKIRSLTLTGWQWRWRTEWVRNGEVGVWSENYRREGDVDASIKAHRVFLGDAPMVIEDRKAGTIVHKARSDA